MKESKEQGADSQGDWSGVITNVRISPTADPELYRELSKSAHRERSRRLRSLALLGLYAASHCELPGTGLQQGQDVGVQPENRGEESQDRKRSEVKGIAKRLLGSLPK